MSEARCPFCHESIDTFHTPGQPWPWIACAACLARHHTACWEEARGVCATCGGTKALERDYHHAADTRLSESERRYTRVLFAFSLVVSLVTFAVLLPMTPWPLWGALVFAAMLGGGLAALFVATLFAPFRAILSRKPEVDAGVASDPTVEAERERKDRERERER